MNDKNPLGKFAFLPSSFGRSNETEAVTVCRIERKESSLYKAECIA